MVRQISAGCDENDVPYILARALAKESLRNLKIDVNTPISRSFNVRVNKIDSRILDYCLELHVKYGLTTGNNLPEYTVVANTFMYILMTRVYSADSVTFFLNNYQSILGTKDLSIYYRYLDKDFVLWLTRNNSSVLDIYSYLYSYIVQLQSKRVDKISKKWV